jgi:argininosuccinate lyase
MEQALTQRAGAAGRKIHTARSRNDQVATLIRMFVRSAGQAFAAKLATLTEVLCTRADAWSGIPMPLQTHTQFAAPGNAGFWAMRYATGLDRVRRHVQYCVGEWGRFCPLGACAVAGSSIAIDRAIQARELGFEAPSPNALDSTSSRDECVEFLALAAQAALQLQSLATDLIGFGGTLHGWLRYPVDFATGSSMMPNKSNPDALELMRGEACALAAAHGHAVLLLKGLPSGYNRDLQCIKPLIRDAASRLEALCELAADFMERVDFDAARIRAAMQHGHIDATLRMEERVSRGEPLREAHHAVAADLRDRPSASDVDWSAAIERYATAGSASPVETRRAAKALLAELRAETKHPSRRGG